MSWRVWVLVVLAVAAGKWCARPDPSWPVLAACFLIGFSAAMCGELWEAHHRRQQGKT